MAVQQAYYMQKTSPFVMIPVLANSDKGTISYWVKPSSVTNYNVGIPGVNAGVVAMFLGTAGPTTINVVDYATGTGSTTISMFLAYYGTTVATVIPFLSCPAVNGGLGDELELDSSVTLTMDAWNNVIFAWNITTGVFQVYVNRVSALDIPNSVLPASGFVIPWALSPTGQGVADYRVGFQCDACLRELYINTNEFVDLSITANLDKFITAGGGIQVIGGNGSSVTGTAPTLYMPLLNASIGTNAAGSGDFSTVYAPSISTTVTCSTDPA